MDEKAEPILTTNIVVVQKDMVTDNVLNTYEIPCIYNPDHVLQFTLTRSESPPHIYELRPCLTTSMLESAKEEEEEKVSECYGCRNGLQNQEAHMDYPHGCCADRDMFK